MPAGGTVPQRLASRRKQCDDGRGQIHATMDGEPNAVEFKSQTGGQCFFDQLSQPVRTMPGRGSTASRASGPGGDCVVVRGYAHRA